MALKNTPFDCEPEEWNVIHRGRDRGAHTADVLTAQNDPIAPRIHALNRQTRYLGGPIGKSRFLPALEIIATERGDAHCDVVQFLLALGRGDDDLLQTPLGRIGVRPGRTAGQQERGPLAPGLKLELEPSACVAPPTPTPVPATPVPAPAPSPSS